MKIKRIIIFYNLEWCTHAYNVAYSKAKSWVFTSPEGETFSFENLKLFCRVYNLTYSSMIRLNQGKFKQHKGWTNET